MNFNLSEKAKEKIIVVAHRGTFTANIPCNTLPAFKAAIASGADMIEIDVDASKDGTLYIFHPYMEGVFLGTKTRIPTLTDEEISALRYRNYDHTPTQFKLNTLEEVLEELRVREIEPVEVEYPTDEYLGGITVGSLYLDYYIIEFDADAVCDSCYHGECEE